MREPVPSTDETAVSGDARMFWPGYGLLLPAIGLSLLALMTGLFLLDRALYLRIMEIWMVVPYEVFADLRSLAAINVCWRAGVDVYTAVPCDPIGGVFNYSPLWLRLDFLPTDIRFVPGYGLALAGLFLVSLGALPRPRARDDLQLVILGSFSSLTAFALERGNADVLIFVVLLLAGLCLTRGGGLRLLGYVLILVAGFLKLYPLVALLLLLRERLRWAISLGALAAAAIGVFGWSFADELPRMARNLPVGPFAGHSWAAANLPGGIVYGARMILDAVGWAEGVTFPPPEDRLLIHLVELAMGLSATWLALRIAAMPAVKLDLSRCPTKARVLLTIGAIVVVGCFFAGQSLGYRGIFLLLPLPSLLALGRAAEEPHAATIFRCTAYGTIFLLWMMTVQGTVARLFGGVISPVTGGPGHVVWAARELVWWGVIAVLMAILIRFVLDSPAWRDLGALLGRGDSVRLGG